MRLIHVVDLSQTLTTTTHRYTMQTAWADRPAEDVRTGQLRCTTCGNLVGFRLYSVARARLRRRWEIATALIGVPAAVLAVIALIQLDMADNLSLAASFGLLGVAGIGGLAGAVAVLMAVNEDGVLLDRKRRNGFHDFKPLHQNVARKQPQDADSPEPAEIHWDA
jgi:hypothetical protein